VLGRGIIGCFAVMVVAPAALAAAPSTGLRPFRGIEVAPSCSPSPGGLSEFQFVVVNRRPTTVKSVRLDVYFGSGTRLTIVPGHHDPRTMFHIVSRHAWKASRP
jgi:hypothetical protein